MSREMSLRQWEERQQVQQEWFKEYRHLIDAILRGDLVVFEDCNGSLQAAQSFSYDMSRYVIYHRPKPPKPPKPPEPPKGAEPKYRPFRDQMEAVRNLAGNMIITASGAAYSPYVAEAGVDGLSFDDAFNAFKIIDGYKTWPCGVRVNEDGTDYVE